MSQIVPFRFETQDVRVIEQDGEPWFVARDIAEILGYANPQKAVRDHCKMARPIGGERGVQAANLDPQTVIIPERDVYRLIMRSRLPKAVRFEEWVVAEVLPSIRKTGSYSVTKTPAQQIDAIQAMLDVIKTTEARVTRVEQAVENLGAHASHLTVRSYATLNGIKITTEESSRLGKAAKQLSEQRGYVICTIPDPNYTKVNTYHRDILQHVFGQRSIAA